MITEKAMILSERAKRREGNFIEAANELRDEIIANCRPTREEFTELIHGVTYTADMLWDFSLWIPRWAAMESLPE